MGGGVSKAQFAVVEAEKAALERQLEEVKRKEAAAVSAALKEAKEEKAKRDQALSDLKVREQEWAKKNGVAGAALAKELATLSQVREQLEVESKELEAEHQARSKLENELAEVETKKRGVESELNELRDIAEAKEKDGAALLEAERLKHRQVMKELRSEMETKKDGIESEINKLRSIAEAKEKDGAALLEAERLKHKQVMKELRSESVQKVRKAYQTSEAVKKRLVEEHAKLEDLNLKFASTQKAQREVQLTAQLSVRAVEAQRQALRTELTKQQEQALVGAAEREAEAARVLQDERKEASERRVQLEARLEAKAKQQLARVHEAHEEAVDKAKRAAEQEKLDAARQLKEATSALAAEKERLKGEHKAGIEEAKQRAREEALVQKGKTAVLEEEAASAAASAQASLVELETRQAVKVAALEEEAASAAASAQASLVELETRQAVKVAALEGTCSTLAVEVDAKTNALNALEVEKVTFDTVERPLLANKIREAEEASHRLRSQEAEEGAEKLRVKQAGHDLAIQLLHELHESELKAAKEALAAETVKTSEAESLMKQTAAAAAADAAEKQKEAELLLVEAVAEAAAKKKQADSDTAAAAAAEVAHAERLRKESEALRDAQVKELRTSLNEALVSSEKLREELRERQRTTGKEVEEKEAEMQVEERAAAAAGGAARTPANAKAEERRRTSLSEQTSATTAAAAAKAPSFSVVSEESKNGSGDSGGEENNPKAQGASSSTVPPPSLSPNTLDRPPLGSSRQQQEQQTQPNNQLLPPLQQPQQRQLPPLKEKLLKGRGECSGSGDGGLANNPPSSSPSLLRRLPSVDDETTLLVELAEEQMSNARNQLLRPRPQKQADGEGAFQSPLDAQKQETKEEKRGTGDEDGKGAEVMMGCDEEEKVRQGQKAETIGLAKEEEVTRRAGETRGVARGQVGGEVSELMVNEAKATDLEKEQDKEERTSHANEGEGRTEVEGAERRGGRGAGEGSEGRDFTVLVDASSSMRLVDRTPFAADLKKTRWDLAREALEVLAAQVVERDDDGITLYFFSSGYKKFPNVRSSQEVFEVFQGLGRPKGGTQLAGALAEALGNSSSSLGLLPLLGVDKKVENSGGGGGVLTSGGGGSSDGNSSGGGGYGGFDGEGIIDQHRGQRQQRRRPETVLVISDGAPEKRKDVEAILQRVNKEAASSSSLLRVVFVQIGADLAATRWLAGLKKQQQQQQLWPTLQTTGGSSSMRASLFGTGGLPGGGAGAAGGRNATPSTVEVVTSAELKSLGLSFAGWVASSVVPGQGGAGNGGCAPMF